MLLDPVALQGRGWTSGGGGPQAQALEAATHFTAT